LARLTQLAPDTTEFDELVEELVAQLRKHVAFEDKVLLALASATSGPERTKLGRRFRVAEAQQ